MAKVDWCHLCDHAFLDQAGKPCVIGIFTRIAAARVPVTHSHAAIAMGISGGRGEVATLRVMLHRPGHQDPLVNVTNPHLELGAGGGHYAIINLHDLNLPDFGLYEVWVELGGETVRGATFELVRTGPAPQLAN